MPFCPKYIRVVVNVVVTLTLWGYFTLGFLLFFSPLYAAAFFFAKERRQAFEKLNHLFFRSFVWLMRVITPGLEICIDEPVKTFGACVVIANHRSYLDAVLLTAAFPQHTTVVKSDFFRTPVFGAIIREAGYIPSDAWQGDGSVFMERMENLPEFFARGGVAFIFPEGTRTRTGEPGEFNKGAFKVARRFQVPIEILWIANTDRLFSPGRFLFHTCIENRIEVRRAGRIPADQIGGQSVKETIKQARGIMLEYARYG